MASGIMNRSHALEGEIQRQKKTAGDIQRQPPCSHFAYESAGICKVNQPSDNDDCLTGKSRKQMKTHVLLTK